MINKKALRKAMWGSVAKFVGVFMAAGAGSMLHQMAGDKIQSVAVGFLLAVCGWLLMLYSEYKREI